MSRTYATKEMREIVPLLKRNGFTHARTRGSHFVFVNRVTGKHITVNKDLNKEVRARLVKQYELI